MEHLNYCRQLRMEYEAALASGGDLLGPEARISMRAAVQMCRKSVKFLLPQGGRVYDDREYRALDDTEPLRLPYPMIALEYRGAEATESRGNPVAIVDGEPVYERDQSIAAPKRIAFAMEHGDWIMLAVAFWAQPLGVWCVLPPGALPRVNYLRRSEMMNGSVPVAFALTNQRVPVSDYADEVGALLCFLNALQCSNVHIARSAPKGGGRKVKSALPFDTYHLLAVDVPGEARGDGEWKGGTHRSPREHLRRGHIRRLSDGRRLWINATVVCAGRGDRGMVTKDYTLRGGEGQNAGQVQ